LDSDVYLAGILSCDDAFGSVQRDGLRSVKRTSN
jgi:hypothetical protein